MGEGDRTHLELCLQDHQPGTAGRVPRLCPGALGVAAVDGWRARVCPGLLRPLGRGLAKANPVVGSGAEPVRRAPGMAACSIQLTHIASCAALSNAGAKELRKAAVRFGGPVAGYGKATARDLVRVDRPGPGGPGTLHATRQKVD